MTAAYTAADAMLLWRDEKWPNETGWLMAFLSCGWAAVALDGGSPWA